MSILKYECTHYFDGGGVNISGIREKKRMSTRKKILDISKELFEQNGYKQVRTSEIAKLAGIGEGTLFNYFKSKGELFISALFENFMTSSYAFSTLSEMNEEEFIMEIVNIIGFYVKEVKNIDKKLIRGYFSILYDDGNTDAVSAKQSLVNADLIIANNLRTLFNYAVDKYEGASDFNVETAVKCIYGCSNTVFNEYVYNDEMSYETMIESIKEQVRFIMNGNISW
jgi:AcrR family transcriptional regulator